MISFSFALLLVTFGTACADLNRNDTCTAGSPPCFVGLKCEGGRCVEDPAAPPCYKQLLISHESKLIGRFIPKCTKNGYFIPQQCFCSMCGCVDKNGIELKDFAKVPIRRSKEQTCICAQDSSSYGNLHIIGRMFFCDRIGNYKKIQCLGSACYCADKYGKPIPNTVVEVAKYDTLKC